jgi:hypothetical protein
MTGPLVWDFDWRRVANDVGRKDLVVADVGGGLGGVLAMVLEALPEAKVPFTSPSFPSSASRWCDDACTRSCLGFLRRASCSINRP